jgi:hypothetical protein
MGELRALVAAAALGAHPPVPPDVVLVSVPLFE